MTKQFRLPVQPVSETKKTTLEFARDWAKSHQEMLAVGALLILLLVFGIPYYQKSQKQTEMDAANMLNMAEYYLNSTVDPKKGPFKTEDDKIQQSIQAFQRILNNYSGTPSARIAQFYIGKCQYLMKQYPQAYVSFDVASGELKNSPLADAAVLGKIYCMVSQKNTQESIKMFEAFISERGKSYLLPEARLSYSDLLLEGGEKMKAIEQLGLLVKESPDTFWGKEATRRMKSIGS